MKAAIIANKGYDSQVPEEGLRKIIWFATAGHRMMTTQIVISVFSRKFDPVPAQPGIRQRLKGNSNMTGLSDIFIVIPII